MSNSEWTRYSQQIITCCRDCDRRKVGCHSTCEDYLRQRKERDEYLGRNENAGKFFNDKTMTQGKYASLRRAQRDKLRRRGG